VRTHTPAERALLGREFTRLAPVPVLLLSLATCGPSNPCTAAAMHLQARYAQRYAGRWTVAHSDTLTLPQLGDRFKLSDVVLGTTRSVVGKTCRFRGMLVFTVPRDTLAVTWIGFPEQALIYGWPAELGPFAGIGAVRVGDSLAGEILFDQRLNVQVRPGVTARFTAGRARD
jgi:hypothetical protein